MIYQVLSKNLDLKPKLSSISSMHFGEYYVVRFSAYIKDTDSQKNTEWYECRLPHTIKILIEINKDDVDWKKINNLCGYCVYPKDDIV